MIINENIIKAANRLFLLLIGLSILLLTPWPQRGSNDSPNSLLEWISMHLSSTHHKKTTSHTRHHFDHNSHNSFEDGEDINSKFMHALARGFYDVGIVLVVWFTGMFILGGACRAYLCIEGCWSRREYGVLPLYRYGEDGVGDENDEGEGDVVMGNLRDTGGGDGQVVE